MKCKKLAISPSSVRVGDADRRKAVEFLQRSYETGHIRELGELENLTGKALMAVTQFDLSRIVEDLPGGLEEETGGFPERFRDAPEKYPLVFLAGWALDIFIGVFIPVLTYNLAGGQGIWVAPIATSIVLGALGFIFMMICTVSAFL